ncbi:MAG TPA: hypothetical protein VFE45_11530 [Coriobacteriia bacterium]|nr:hypothetical protein [Coriobacteriia bacterium]
MDESLAFFLQVVSVSSAVSTAIATGVALWLRQRDKPEPDWELRIREGRGAFAKEPSDDARFSSPYSIVAVTNVGDGAAYQVMVEGINCFAEHRVVDPRQGGLPTTRLLPVVPSGDSFDVRVFYATGLSPEMYVRMEWVPAPTRISRSVVDVVPLLEGRTPADSAASTWTTPWRYRELRWWQLRQRARQWSSRRTRRASVRRSFEARTAMRQWLAGAKEQSQQDSGADRS